MPAHQSSEAKAVVVRAGAYGKKARRQRYKCFYTEDGMRKSHTFSPDLPREHVGSRRMECHECSELISVHRGAQSSSRQSTWPLNAVVDALSELSAGGTYAQTSLDLQARARLAREHLAKHGAAAPLPISDDLVPATSLRTEDGRRAWHLTADLVEQYGPVLAHYTQQQARERDEIVRVRNDALREAGVEPVEPIVFVLDEVSVRLRQAGGSRVGWTIHAVGEVVWNRDKRGNLRRDYRLRVARALPGPGNAESWALVLLELGVVPDVLIADFAGSIAAGADFVYAGHPVLRIPSMFHFLRAMSDLLEQDGFHAKEGNELVPLPEFRDHLGLISRDYLVDVGVAGWSAWWDHLEALAAAAGAPASAVKNRRDRYEKVIAAVIPQLVANPQLPASNSSIENKIRNLLKPILRGRSQQYRNLARINGLLDLVVCRDHGVFLDRALPARLIREDNLAGDNNGWATPTRTYDDPQPPALDDLDTDPINEAFYTQPEGAEPVELTEGAKGAITTTKKTRARYASLLDVGLVSALLDKRLNETEGLLP